MCDFLKISIDKIACLTGHRPKSLPWGYNERKLSCLRFKKDIKKLLENNIKNGVSIFLTGMALGFDMIATEILLKLRKKYNHIKIIAVIPCIGQDLKWKPLQQKRYRKIINKCDDKILIADRYTPTCMNERNEFMVKNSSVCIACLKPFKPSGTANTVKLAKKYNRKIYIINPDDYK